MTVLQPGSRLGERYRLESLLGAGGMGEVWRGVDEVLGRTVAVKVMLPEVADDPAFAQRFLAEATVMARVNHPAVASIHDYGHSAGVTFLVMEYIDGQSLAQVLARVGRIAPAETMRLVAQAADGLQAVHDLGIVHRDVKPANLLIRRDGSVVITDFGIARRHDASRLTVSGAVLGTPSYLSPEQVLGHPATARSDVYALGLTAYECLAGERPFVGDNPYAVALQRLQVAPRTIGVNLPGSVLAVVERALATDPALRWPSAAELANTARAAASGAAVAAPPVVSAPSMPQGAAFWPQSAGNSPPSGGFPRPGSFPRPVSGFPPPGTDVLSSPGVPAPRSTLGKRRPALLAAVAAVVLVTGGVTAFVATRDRDTAASATPPAVSSAAASVAPSGFTACGDAFCPVEPMCWGGLTSISGKAMPPSEQDCARDHVWETFVAIAMPAGLDRVRADELIQQRDVAATCSASLMRSRSSDPAKTRTWLRDAWPIGDLLHCLAKPEETLEHKGAAF